MNKAGFVVSLIGGLLALFFSLMLAVTGPYFYAGGDITDFTEENEDELVTMWVDIGRYNKVEMLPEAELKDYINDYTEVLQGIDADELRDIADEYDMRAFNDLARIYEDISEFIPRLKICIIACLAASVIALAGAAVAKVARVAGSVMVFSGAGLLLVFSLIASSILPMALASLLLIIGGVLQIVRRVPMQTGEVAK